MIGRDSNRYKLEIRPVGSIRNSCKLDEVQFATTKTSVVSYCAVGYRGLFRRTHERRNENLTVLVGVFATDEFLDGRSLFAIGSEPLTIRRSAERTVPLDSWLVSINTRFYVQAEECTSCALSSHLCGTSLATCSDESLATWNETIHKKTFHVT